MIIDWLYHLGVNAVFKYSFPDLIHQDGLEMNLETLNGRTSCSLRLNSVQINSVWFWRDEFFYPQFEPAIQINDRLKTSISSHLTEELDVLRKFIFNDKLVKNFKMLSNSAFQTLNKLEVLSYATQVGLDIPNYIITNSKQDLLKFKKRFGSIITKSINEGLVINSEQYLFSQYTEEVTDDVMNEIPERFFPSLFQEKIDKTFEIRSFVLDKKFYSMAIFSQTDKQTQVDFRRYNQDKWNRNVPYTLPQKVCEALLELMDLLSLNTASIDFIKDVEGRYVFLEINPNGQFNMVSKPCNYNLEKKIAESMIV